MKEQKKLGIKIKELREKRSLTRHELSMLSMVNYTTLMNIENGKTNPKVGTLYRISVFLDVRLKELFNYE
ncbi:MAG: helix-turn-helix transcriptional regulator [Acholeplasmataceae bacterium]|nr:helix-turn-helix transcriptional regulator [Acholeplasmataceae bacterium]